MSCVLDYAQYCMTSELAHFQSRDTSEVKM
jgi:hypothetical protein